MLLEHTNIVLVSTSCSQNQQSLVFTLVGGISLYLNTHNNVTLLLEHTNIVLVSTSCSHNH